MSGRGPMGFSCNRSDLSVSGAALPDLQRSHRQMFCTARAAGQGAYEKPEVHSAASECGSGDRLIGASGGCARSFVQDQAPDHHIALALDRNVAQRLRVDGSALESSGCGWAQEDSLVRAERREPRRDVHRVTPEVEAELAAPDDARDHRAEIDLVDSVGGLRRRRAPPRRSIERDGNSLRYLGVAGWGTWIRTRTARSRAESSTVKLSPKRHRLWE